MDPLRKLLLILVTLAGFVWVGLYYHFHAFDHEFFIDSQISSDITLTPVGLEHEESSPILLPIQTGSWLSNAPAANRSLMLPAGSELSFIYDSRNIIFRWILAKDQENRVFRLELGDGRLFSHFSIGELPPENQILPARCQLNPAILDCQLLRLTQPE